VWKVSPRELRRRVGDVYVIEDHGGALAAQLELAWHEVPTARFADQSSDFRRSGE
jgi:hypothetical protein